MTLPVGPHSIYSVPPTEEMLAHLAYVKWCVLLTYLCAVGRFMADEPFGALDDLFGASFGTFLLKEETILRPFRAISGSERLQKRHKMARIPLSRAASAAYRRPPWGRARVA